MNEDLWYFRQVVRRRWPVAASALLFVTAMALLLAVLWPPVYRADAVLLVEPQNATTPLGRSETHARLNALAQRLMTRTSLLELSGRLGLHESQLVDADAVLNDMRARISVTLHGGGTSATTLRVAFDSANPRVAANVANMLAEILLAESVTADSPVTILTVDILQRQARRLDEDLDRTIAEISAFRQANRDALPDALPALHRRAGDLRDSLATAALADQPEAAFAPDIGDLQAQLEVLQDTIETAERNAIALERLEREHDSARARLDATMTRIASFRNTASDDAGDSVFQLTVLESAAAPSSPVSPNRTVIVAGGVILGLLAGFCFAAVSEWLDRTIRRPRDLERHFGLAPFAVIPHLPDIAGDHGRGVARIWPGLVWPGLAAPLGLATALVFLHVFWQPLDALLLHWVTALGLVPLLEQLRQGIFG